MNSKKKRTELVREVGIPGTSCDLERKKRYICENTAVEQGAREMDWHVSAWGYRNFYFYTCFILFFFLEDQTDFSLSAKQKSYSDDFYLPRERLTLFSAFRDTGFRYNNKGVKLRNEKSWESSVSHRTFLS